VHQSLFAGSACAALGLTGVVITEHDWLWSEDELDELRAASPAMQVYAGVEVSAHEGHFLCMV